MHTDQDGVIHFSNRPTSTKFRVYMRESSQEKLPRTTTHYDHYIQAASSMFDVAFPLVKSVIRVESNFNPSAVSQAGAMGLMQLMPENLRVLKVQDPFDPWENILGGTRYLKTLINRYKGKLSLTLAAYNAGPSAVTKYNGVPPFRETRDYIKKVMKFYHLYQDEPL